MAKEVKSELWRDKAEPPKEVKEYCVDTGHPQAKIRLFETGATRSAADGKLEYRRFLSPTALRRYAEFMHKNRLQPDGSVREPDNWKKGITKDSYMDSLGRHFMELWLLHDGQEAVDEHGNPLDRQTVLCALIFNSIGYLHEDLKNG